MERDLSKMVWIVLQMYAVIDCRIQAFLILHAMRIYRIEVDVFVYFPAFAGPDICLDQRHPRDWLIFSVRCQIRKDLCSFSRIMHYAGNPANARTPYGEIDDRS